MIEAELGMIVAFDITPFLVSSPAIESSIASDQREHTLL